MIDLRQGDCLEIMDILIDEGIKVDAIITDPPYLINYKTNRRKDKQHDFCSAIKNDDEFNFNLWVEKADILLKQDTPIYIFGSWKTEPYFREVFSKKWKHKNNIVWVKNNWTAGDLKAQYGQQYELIMLYNKGRSPFLYKRYSDVWEVDRVSGKKAKHQNQKPVDLLERIIVNAVNTNGIVLDCFMGSGSTLVACKNTGRNGIGIELDERYFEIAEKRINENLIGF